MVTDHLRCPYCVVGNEFNLMRSVNGQFLCGKCGHTIAFLQRDYSCGCGKCQAMRALTSEWARVESRSVGKRGDNWKKAVA
jgi:DNA-directed RNA polymerase subunit RPC12/RpoP